MLSWQTCRIANITWALPRCSNACPWRGNLEHSTWGFMQLNKNTMVMWRILRWDNWHNVQPSFCLTSADLSLRQWGDIKFVYILKESMFQVPREINLESQVQELATWSLIRAWAAPCKSDSFGATLPSRSFWTATDEAENCHIWNNGDWGILMKFPFKQQKLHSHHCALFSLLNYVLPYWEKDCHSF